MAGDLKTHITIEAPSGSGELRVAGAHLARVFYHLRVRRAVLVEGSVDGPQDGAPGGLEITGEVTISQDEPMQAQVMRRLGSGELLSLHLNDGRTLDVYAAQVEAVSGVYHLVSARPMAGFQKRGEAL